MDYKTFKIYIDLCQLRGLEMSFDGFDAFKQTIKIHKKKEEK